MLLFPESGEPLLLLLLLLMLLEGLEGVNWRSCLVRALWMSERGFQPPSVLIHLCPEALQS